MQKRGYPQLTALLPLRVIFFQAAVKGAINVSSKLLVLTSID